MSSDPDASAQSWQRKPSAWALARKNHDSWKRNRYPHGVEPFDPLWDKTVQSFLDRITVDKNGCWVWIGQISPGGYGMFRSWDGVLAHRYSYCIFNGPLVKGEVIDHLCRNHMCCNPSHLESVTPLVNTFRGVSPAAINMMRTHCAHGHEFTEENTAHYLSGEKRMRACRKCRSLIKKKQNEKLKLDRAKKPCTHKKSCPHCKAAIGCESDSMLTPQDAPATLVRASRNADAMRVVGRWA